MPNWCYNMITVTGEKSSLENLLKFVKTENSEFDFNTVLPYPKEYAEQDEIIDNEWPHGGKGFNNGGYHWCIQNWGTKWPACDVTVSKTKDGDVIFSFDTAWSPSTPVTAALSVAFPELTFKHAYEEGDCDFSGYDVFDMGELVNSATGSFSDYPIGEHGPLEIEE